MTYKILPVVAIIATLLTFTSCKTSEANYKAAYETAKARQQGTSPTEGTIYNRFRDRAETSAVVSQTGDTVAIRVEAIGFPADGGATRDDMLKYNVVTGGFKQIFNAKAMRDRLIGLGYKAFIVNTAEPLYYVVAATAPTVEEISVELKKVGDDKSLMLRSPYPYVLQPKHIK